MTSTSSNTGKFTMNRRKMLVLTGAGMGALGLGVAGGPAVAQEAGMLRYGESGAFSTFNPWAQVENQASTANQIFSRLVYKNREGEYVADLAESWTIADDGKSVTFKLRPGVKWHDGKPLEAQDFVNMYGYLSDPALEPEQGVQKIKSLFEPVTAIEAPDSATVHVTFSEALPYALDIMHYFYAIRMEDPADTGFLQALPVGTGPFSMDEHVRGQYASFSAFEDYHVPDQPKVANFRFHVFAQGASPTANLTSDQIDGLLISNQAEVESLSNNPDLDVHNVPTGTYILQINVSKPPFDNVLVRRALSHSLNRQAFADAVHFGIEKPTATPFFDEASIAYLPELVDAYPYDLDEARRLLDEAGVSNLRMVYPAPSSLPNYGTYGEIWQADLAQIGVDLDVQRVDVARWREYGAGKVPGTDVSPWAVGRVLLDPAIFFAANSGYRAENHRFGYENEELNTLIAAGKVETDPVRRREIYQKLNRIVTGECWALPLVSQSRSWAWSKKVSGVESDIGTNLILAGTGKSA